MISIIRNRIRDEERIRCFLLKNTTNGYLLLQSEGPSCQGYCLKIITQGNIHAIKSKLLNAF